MQRVKILQESTEEPTESNLPGRYQQKAALVLPLLKARWANAKAQQRSQETNDVSLGSPEDRGSKASEIGKGQATIAHGRRACGPT